MAVEPVVTSLDNGATLTTFVLPSGEVVEVTTPPAQFTPLSATQSQLIEFGFPPRPLDAADLEAWTAAMAAYDSSPAPDGPMEVVTGPATMADFTVYGGWGGWVAGTIFGTDRSYVAVKGNLRVPSITGTCGALHNTQPLGVGFWIGLGGTGSDLVQQGFECGNAHVGSGSAIRPFTQFADTSTPHAFCGQTSWTLAPGDVIYQNMSYQASTNKAYFYLEDQTSGVAHSCSATGPVGWTANLATAEWIAEGPSFQSIQFSAAHFTNARAELSASSTWVTLGSQPVTPFVDGIGGTAGDYCIKPGAIGSDQVSFTDTWYQIDCY